MKKKPLAGPPPRSLSLGQLFTMHTPPSERAPRVCVCVCVCDAPLFLSPPKTFFSGASVRHDKVKRRILKSPNHCSHTHTERETDNKLFGIPRTSLLLQWIGCNDADNNNPFMGIKMKRRHTRTWAHGSTQFPLAQQTDGGGDDEKLPHREREKTIGEDETVLPDRFVEDDDEIHTGNKVVWFFFLPSSEFDDTFPIPHDDTHGHTHTLDTKKKETTGKRSSQDEREKSFLWACFLLTFERVIGFLIHDTRFGLPASLSLSLSVYNKRLEKRGSVNSSHRNRS